MLAAAPDLAYLKDATPEVQMLQDFFKQAQQPPEPSNTPRILQDLVQQHRVAKLLAQASGRALQLMLRATSKEQSKPARLQVYARLQTLLPSFVLGWTRCLDHLESAAEAAAGKEMALQQLQETDILQQIFAACERDTAWLEQQLLQQHNRQQQQQQPGAKKQ
uniref:Uncharacterized protein n=1 Tax=Tetradesmus obliquus TaxID=3088 RepID=A0A383W0H9_TETOB|eukprot:jgi/Sobl393_1/954/SZX70603.1